MIVWRTIFERRGFTRRHKVGTGNSTQILTQTSQTHLPDFSVLCVLFFSRSKWERKRRATAEMSLISAELEGTQSTVCLFVTTTKMNLFGARATYLFRVCTGLTVEPAR
ncbi:Uncharacterized protein APZ42_033242 [Daphnia magna]|uniref:Uncharacterized protein n=1 Tax=Daphnia magna TaxID=35525 RepID=A0A164L8V8_9CRUS|nr:Uncharacterized protein APZ42_033242 [Daphnia magna]